MHFADTFGQIAKDDRAALYLQVQKRLREAIRGGALHGGDPIPPERDLAEALDISRNTVRKAVDGLVSEGLLLRKRGAGTFVNSRVEKNVSKLSSFSEDMLSRGRRPHSEWISKVAGAVTPEEALALMLSPGSAVYRFHRVRFADGVAMAIEFAIIPAYCLPSPELVQESLYAALETHAHRPARALQRLQAVSLSSEQAERLGVSPGAAALSIERRGFLGDGRACEFTQSWYRGDAYDVIAELNGAS